MKSADIVDHLQNDVVVPPDGGVEAMVREIVQAAEMARKGEANQGNGDATRRESTGFDGN